jgi:hypothetical protein
MGDPQAEIFDPWELPKSILNSEDASKLDSDDKLVEQVSVDSLVIVWNLRPCFFLLLERT